MLNMCAVKRMFKSFSKFTGWVSLVVLTFWTLGLALMIYSPQWSGFHARVGDVSYIELGFMGSAALVMFSLAAVCVLLLGYLAYMFITDWYEDSCKECHIDNYKK